MKNIAITKSITPRDTESLDLYFKDVAHEKLISQEEEFALAKAARHGDKRALDKLITANLRFVITVAKQYQGRGLPLEDLIAEGNIGLIKAAEKFDETKGFRFISYAVWWIKQSIIKAIYYTANSVRLPTSQIEPNAKLNKLITEYERIHMTKPSLEELAELSGFSEDYIRSVQSSTNTCISIDAPSLDDSEDCTIADCIPNPNSDDPAVLANNSIVSEGVEQILSKLSNRDHDIICMTMGLQGCNEMSYEEIGHKFNLSAERIRQLHHSLLKTFKTQYACAFNALL
jgi:RNA polymerase primary sigma factor